MSHSENLQTTVHALPRRHAETGDGFGFLLVCAIALAGLLVCGHLASKYPLDDQTAALFAQYP